MNNKFRIILLLVVFSMAESVFAQEGKFRFEVGTNTSLYDSEYKVVEPNFNIGYNFTDKLFASFKTETPIALFKTNQLKDYFINTLCGLDVGYKVCNIGNSSLDVKAGVGTTLSDKDWKYVSYDGGLYLNIGKANVKPVVGLGLKYYDSRNDLFDNYFRAFMSVGFSFDLK